MFRLPPLKTKTFVLIFIVNGSLLLLARLLNGSGGSIKTVESALLIALASLIFPALCFGSLCSIPIRNLIFEPSEEPEKSELTLLFVGIISSCISIFALNQAWAIFQQMWR